MTRTEELPERGSEEREYDLSLHVFSISAGMVGVCLTGIGLLRVAVNQTSTATVGDELLALDALLFLVCCTLSFWCFKTRRASHRNALRWTIDTLFMLALATMVAVCGAVTYAIA